ncbi:MAG: FAD-dependent oxidoreductase [Acidimicrobiaceae bacterium]|nr:FAD-dependent oxidoreductase [Acidimicrobiaceae bacterium]MCY4281059.1 FAD-dependent oxidoreductase [Acidimicrobiaceae bacterium]MCY4294325.1 FAD-dependent oxidoreductase [Acidimicrobiaceae bacterium]
MRVVVIGAGIAGASAAWHLAEDASVVMVERESQAGAHATGRSAAMFTETFGAAAIRVLAGDGRPFLAEPPEGFSEQRLLTPRGLLWIARPGELHLLEQKAAEAAELDVEVHQLDTAACRKLVSVLQPQGAAAGVYEPGAMTIDVDALLQGFLRGARARGAQLHLVSEVSGIIRSASGWRVTAADQHWDCDVVVNAAGAWCDQVAQMAGVAPLGLRPLRRSVFMFPPPSDVSIDAWPLVIEAGYRFYFEPEGELLLASPADETLSEPCDARPETEDIARGVQELEAATTLRVRGVRSTWAGLRTFTSDGVPATGFDPDHPGFFWLAGQGGYGIKTAPALGRLTAALITQSSSPHQQPHTPAPDLIKALDPARFR